ncbi:hypothetical protein ILYODFUR_013733 [Ilyodon furcidens]|uniref:Uncharacterized protein n=1 Tax=Ilyodon furcidens TaxID=33524 RepID=A0ABV0SWT3_9TELE
MLVDQTCSLLINPNTSNTYSVSQHTVLLLSPLTPPAPPTSHRCTVIHRMPKPAALLKARKSRAWPGFKQQCSWDLLHFRQAALSVSPAINSNGGCLPRPRRRGFGGGGKKTLTD